jgi:hypothetical protein
MLKFHALMTTGDAEQVELAKACSVGETHYDERLHL